MADATATPPSNPIVQQIDTLTTLLGFDPGKSPSPTAALMQEVMAEVKKERDDKAKMRAKELLTKAITLREEFAKADRAYNDAKGKFQKEIGKILSTIEKHVKGEDVGGEEPPPEAPAVGS